MLGKRSTILVLLFTLAVVPAVSSARPNAGSVLQRKGQVQGGWCYGSPTTWECDPTWTNDETISIYWHMDGTWAKAGKLVRATSYMGTWGTKIAPDTYRLEWFRYDVRDRRFGDIFEDGTCTGTATVKALISIEVDCDYYRVPGYYETGSFQLHVRAVNERRANDLLVTVLTPVLELAGLGGGCVPVCVAPFEGVYY